MTKTNGHKSELEYKNLFEQEREGEAELEQLLDRAEAEAMDIDVPGIPGRDNRWFSNQGGARRAALAAATAMGPGHRIVHDSRPTRGQPHYHIVDPHGNRMSGHFFYGRRPPRKIYRGRPWREYESEAEAEPDFPPTCIEKLVLDRFELGDYRLRPHHYEPLTNFLLKLKEKPLPPKAALFLRGHADARGNDFMNSGLGFSRALEAQRFIDGALRRRSFQAIRSLPRFASSSGERKPISSNPAVNRRVEIRLCIDDSVATRKR